MSSSTTRRFRPLALLAAPLAAMALVGITATSASAAGSASVSPSTGLSTDDTVAVTATGLDASTSYYVFNCDLDEFADGTVLCDWDAGYYTTATSDSSGDLTASIPVAQEFDGRHYPGASATSITCLGDTGSQCGIVVYPVTHSGSSVNYASASITFD
ncbi:MAG: neocarzinostatin apoprotein domain-containing protein [Nocardioides sp.]|uniref:neocarzinostatin apoprotein domain-containing protein n=1 Tax=Nocardioides sp. TaxID=35761 RepID=UPI0039E47BA8